VKVLRFEEVTCAIHGSEIGGPWSFTVEEGSLSGVITPPSIGEALVRLCVGNEAPIAGSVEVLGEDPGNQSRFEQLNFRRRVGVCFHREGLISNLTLQQNLLVPMIFGGGLGSREADLRVAGILRRLRLERWSDTRPAFLPPEIRIIAGISRAAVHEPELLILEDPATDLQADLAEDLLSWCMGRSGTMLVLPPTVAEPLTSLVDTWIPLAD
jgi:cell division transport system ATP-binding protein